MSENGGHSWRIAAAFIVVSLVWGSTWLVVKEHLALAPAAWALVYRFVLATAAMMALVAARRESLRISAYAVRMALVLGLFQFSANFLLGYAGAGYLTSGIVTVFFALLIIPNALAARVFFGDRLDRRLLAGSAVAVGGIALLLLREYRFAPQGGMAVVIGILCLFGAMMLSTASNLMQATPEARKQPLIPMIAWAMVIGLMANTAYAGLTAGTPVVPASIGFWLGIGYLAIFGSVLTFPLYFYLVRRIGPGRASYTSVLVPVIGMSLSTVFEDYRWTLLTASGAALAVLGLLIALSGRKQPV